MKLFGPNSHRENQPLRAWRYKGYVYLLPDLTLVVRWPQRGPDVVSVGVGLGNARTFAQMPWSTRNYARGAGLDTCTLLADEGSDIVDIAGWRFGLEVVNGLRRLRAWLSVPNQARFKRHGIEHVSRFSTWLGEGLVCPTSGSEPRYTNTGKPVYQDSAGAAD